MTKPNLDYLRWVRLSEGAHYNQTGKAPCDVCAREALCYAVSGVARDETPEGYPCWWAALPPINDMLTDDQRAEILQPRLVRYAIPADTERDERIVWKLADLAVRRFAPDALERAGLGDHAEKLRSLPVVTRETASGAFAAAAAAAIEADENGHGLASKSAGFAANAVDALSKAPITAADARAYLADASAYTAASARYAAYAEKYALIILDAIDAEFGGAP